MVFEHLFRLFITTGGPIKGKHGSSSIELKQQTFEVGCGVVLIQNENLITDDPKLPPWHKILFNVLDLDMDGRITKSNVAVWFNLFITSTLREICPSACYDSDEEDEDDAGFDYIDKIVDKFFLLSNNHFKHISFTNKQTYITNANSFIIILFQQKITKGMTHKIQ